MSDFSSYSNNCSLLKMPLCLILPMPKLKNWSLKKRLKNGIFTFYLKKFFLIKYFRALSDRLARAFSHIAQTSFSIRVLDTHYTEQLIADYWLNCIQEIDGISPPILKLLHGQIPSVQGNKLLIKVRTEMESMSLRRNTPRLISKFLKNMVFHR